jgi:hypothetical protein
MLAIMTVIVRAQNFMTTSLMIRLFSCDLSRFTKGRPVAPREHRQRARVLHDLYRKFKHPFSLTGDIFINRRFVKRTSVLPPTGSLKVEDQRKMKGSAHSAC